MSSSFKDATENPEMWRRVLRISLPHSLQPDAVCCSGDDASVSALKIHAGSMQQGDTAPGPGEVHGARGEMAETLLEQRALLVGTE